MEHLAALAFLIILGIGASIFTFKMVMQVWYTIQYKMREREWRHESHSINHPPSDTEEKYQVDPLKLSPRLRASNTDGLDSDTKSHLVQLTLPLDGDGAVEQHDEDPEPFPMAIHMIELTDEIIRGRVAAHMKHGYNSIESIDWRDPRWWTILIEEVGEAAHEMTYDQSQDRLALRAELLDVLSVVSAWVAAIDFYTDGKGDPNQVGIDPNTIGD